MLRVYTDYSSVSHVITGVALKEQLAEFRVNVLKRELNASWHHKLVKIPEGKGWTIKKEKFDQLLGYLGIYGISYDVQPTPFQQDLGAKVHEVKETEYPKPSNVEIPTFSVGLGCGDESRTFCFNPNTGKTYLEPDYSDITLLKQLTGGDTRYERLLRPELTDDTPAMTSGDLSNTSDPSGVMDKVD